MGQSAMAAEVLGSPGAPAPRIVRQLRLGEGAIRAALAACGAFVLLATVAMLGFLAVTGARGAGEAGLSALLSGETWKPEAGSFGGLALIVGTFATATGATIVGALPAMGAAIWLAEFAPESVRRVHRRVMEIASAVPSVIYGWLALVILVPVMARLGRAWYGPNAP
ncbi:MAG: hypothetical protein ACREJ3_02780, partial [Polyangiaceae bacterium]